MEGVPDPPSGTSSAGTSSEETGSSLTGPARTRSALARRLAARPPRSIGIVMLSAIGDAVHVLPVANALKRRWPDTRITWIIQPVPHMLVRNHRAIDDFILFRRRRGLEAWKGFAELGAEVRSRHFDVVLALQVYFKAGIITGLLSADIKLGFDRRRARDLNWIFTDEKIPPGPNQHVQDQYFEFVEHMGVSPEPVEWGIELTPAEEEDQSRFFAEVDGPVCAVVVGTSKKEKNWTPEGYARVLDQAHVRHGLQPVLVGGPSAVERAIADEILARSRAPVVDTLGDDLRRLVWILDGAALTLSPDTGPLHISRALDTPVVGLYGYTNPKRTGPYRKYTDLVVDGYAREPGEDYPVSMEYRDGMSRVTPEAVLEKVDRAMDRYVNPSTTASGARDRASP
ncbi:MAG: glycosyltransferase family 9 protein [Longimicrobiales bacterium]|nr:glycosyltransferase family 9 protein [Longimicrobiales bacterium]